MRLAWFSALCLLWPTAATSQTMTVGVVDFYGLRQLRVERVREALAIPAGSTFDSEDSARRAVDAARGRLRALPGVQDAQINPVCCDAGKWLFYVGVVEAGRATPRVAVAPTGRQRLPDDVVEAGDAFQKAWMAAVEKGDAGEDDSQGHALSNNAAVRAIEDRFITFAARDAPRLRDVLAHSGAAEHRALAALVLGYSTDKKAIVAPLSRAMRDPDENVRNNAMRALAIIAGYAGANPQLDIRVDPVPFVRLLDSPSWTDRNKSTFALEEMSQQRPPGLLGLLRQQALPSLVEMARWKSRLHAGAPFFILGRVGGLSEDEIKAAWDRDDREAVIAAATLRR